ncbi:unnamed protein product [Arctogadus glacialis]
MEEKVRGSEKGRNQGEPGTEPTLNQPNPSSAGSPVPQLDSPWLPHVGFADTGAVIQAQVRDWSGPREHLRSGVHPQTKRPTSLSLNHLNNKPRMIREPL